MKLLTIILTLMMTAPLLAQSQARHPGVVFYEQAKYREAVRSLEVASKSKEHKADAQIWNYLGLAYMQTDKIKQGRKAFEKSVKLQPLNPIPWTNLAYAYLLTRQPSKARKAADTVIALDPKSGRGYEIRSTLGLWEGKLDLAERDADAFLQNSPENTQAYMLKSDILVSQLGKRVKAGKAVREEIDFLKRAVETLEAGVRNCAKTPQLPVLERELESMTVFLKHFSREPIPVPQPPGTEPQPEAGVTPVKILYQPKAMYTDRARQANVQGAVRLVILLGADGTVRHVLKLWGLGYGLDENAIAAARAIRFEPKMRDGKPVSVVVTREYTFSIY